MSQWKNQISLTDLLFFKSSHNILCVFVLMRVSQFGFTIQCTQSIHPSPINRLESIKLQQYQQKKNTFFRRKSNWLRLLINCACTLTLEVRRNRLLLSIYSVVDATANDAVFLLILLSLFNFLLSLFYFFYLIFSWLWLFGIFPIFLLCDSP